MRWSQALLDARSDFLQSLFHYDTGLQLLHSMDRSKFLNVTLARLDTIELVARYLHSIRRIFTATAILVSSCDVYRSDITS
jgi:hypothetical protein